MGCEKPIFSPLLSRESQCTMHKRSSFTRDNELYKYHFSPQEACTILYFRGPQSTPKHSLNGSVLCIASAGTGHSGIVEQKFFAIVTERWCFFHLLRNTLQRVACRRALGGCVCCVPLTWDWVVFSHVPELGEMINVSFSHSS